MRFRLRLPAVIVAAGLIPLGLSGTAVAVHSQAAVFRATAVKAEPPALTAAQVRRLAAHATDRSIIIFKNQFASLPVRGVTAQLRVNAANAAQAPVLSELTRLHASHVQGFHLINAIAATISPAEAQRLRANPAVRAVVPDSVQHLATLSSLLSPPGHGTAGHGRARGHGRMAPANAVTHLAQQICPSNPAHPLVEPEARSLMNVDAAQKIVNGAGIKVAVLADGIDPNNPDLIRPNGRHVIFDYKDFSGQGPNAPSVAVDAFLNAGLIAAQGNQVYDLSKFVNPAHPLPAGCNIKLEGISPGVSMAELNWGGNDAAVFNSTIIQTIQYAVMVEHVNVIDEPFGGTAVPNFQNDPPTLANQAAVAAGVVVVAATGDNGSTANNIDSPGGTPGVIGVGASTALRGYVQTDGNGPNLAPGGGWEDNNISSLSSSGINEFDPRTLDVVAPGDIVDSLCGTNTTQFFGCTDTNNGSAQGLVQVGSTAAAAGEVSGVAALVMEAYAKTHHGVMPPAPLVERILVSTATDLGAPADHQGAGLVNALKAVQLAESIGNAHRQGSTLLVNTRGLSATLNAGQSHTFSVKVTNEGRGAQTVTPKVSGNPALISRDAGTVTLSSSSPTYVDGSGFTDSYETHTFKVAAGAGYLNGNITWDSQKAGGAVFEELFDPRGNLAAFSEFGVLQSGYGHVEVRRPMAGTWTTVIYTINVLQFFGPVRFAYSTEKFHTVGSVSPASRTLPPGQSATFHVKVTAGQAGERSFSLHLGTGSSTDGAIPIVLRSLVPITSQGGSFTGFITGDDTPGFSTAGGGQEVTYQFEVPPGEPSLNVGINLRHPDDVLEGALVSPYDESLDLQSTANNANAPGSTMQFFERTPAPGLWTVTLITFAPLDGVHLRMPLTGTISFTAPTVTSSGLPDSASTVLPAGQPVTATVNVTNTGNIAKDFFADPRLDGVAPLQLLGTNVPGGTSYTQPQVSQPAPMPPTVNPHWLIPTDTSGLIGAASATVPISFDMNADDNDPEEQGASSGDNSVATHTAPELSVGQEWAAPQPECPCSAPVNGTSNVVMIAIANPFDSAISASTGDMWAQTVDASAPYTPLTLAPGQSGTITLTITPSAPKGTVVSGFIAVDTFNQATSSGDELINIPYSYTVG
jgi:Subtilase family/Peptidase inhibitor I9